MADAISVPTGGGFSVPPIPASAAPQAPAPVAPPPPPPSSMVPGFVPPPSQVGVTPEQVQQQIAAALAAAKAPQAPVPAAPTPVLPPAGAPVDFGADVNDPVLSSLTDVFLSVGKGIDIERAIGKALTYGDAALIDTAYISEKGGASASQLATLAAAIVQRVQAQTTEATNAVYSTAGDKASWDAAAAVFDQNAPKHLKLVIAQMLDSGNKDAIAAAAKSVVDYTRQNGLVPTPAQMIHAGATSATSAQALGKAEFQDALFKLDPNSRTFEQDRNSLFARRQLGKQLGK